LTSVHDDTALEIAEGERVILRELARGDVDEMARWPRFDEPELQWANIELSTPRERDAWYERSRSNPARRRFTIFARDGRVVGTIGLRNIDFRFGEGTLGIIVNAADVGGGYGTDAVRTIVRFAFERLGLRKVYLDVAEGNERARRCYDRVGFVRIGQHRGPEGINYVDMVLTRDRWARPASLTR
jgi:RimJ/RimL family protein N-acetyltransferase